MRFYLTAVLASLSLSLYAAETNWLDTLDLAPMKQGWGEPQVNKAVTGAPLSIAGKEFERGVGTHASSSLYLDLAGGVERFQASVGSDDAATKPGTIVFRIYADGKKVYDSGVMKRGAAAKEVNVPLGGMKTLLLQVADAGDGVEYDHADWADARFLMAPDAKPPKTITAPVEKAVILTPTAGAEPRINGPTIYGCRPGHPFLYRIPVQGERPLRLSADGLPRSLRLNPTNGIIEGKAPQRGAYTVTLKAKNSRGTSTRKFRIIAGDTLALTPPMGYNHWYAHYDRITDKMMREAADVIISSGMADVGYQYVNVDDCWMNAPSQKDPLRVGPARDAQGRIIANKHFPDMKGLADYIHSLGLKAGLYTSPGKLTCGGFHSAFGYEEIDARTFAEWGYDFLKYDWCSYGQIAKGAEPGTKVPTFGQARDREVHVYPYKLMGDLLKQQPRDIVYNLCQYGMDNVWEWGEEVGGHCWRTAGDLGFELDRVFEVALKNSEHRAWSRPGAWNDPDYLQIGWIGSAHGGGLPAPTTMSPSTQYAYMSMWALMASPLFYSGDMSRMDAFTLNVLCNPEVIDINQDALGQAAAVAAVTEDSFLMIKQLEDGAVAIGLFNRGEAPQQLELPWAVAALKGRQRVRDVWRQQNLGVFDNKFTVEVPRHGGFLVKVERVGK